jgi:hypothetical protein
MTLADGANSLVVIQVAIVLYKQWITSQGRLRLMYWLMIVTGVLGFISNTMLVIVSPEVWGLLATLALMFWSAAMGAKGLLRMAADERYLKDLAEALEGLDGSDTRIIEDLRARGIPIWSIDGEGKLVRTE